MFFPELGIGGRLKYKQGHIKMRVALIISALFLISGCYSRPLTYRIGSDITINDQNLATICSGNAYMFEGLCDQSTRANVIAVDGIVSPAYEKDVVRYFLGQLISPVLYTYCHEISQGSHKITILAKRRNTYGPYLTHGGRASYHYGECIVTIEAGRSYLTIPKPSDRSCYSSEYSDNVVVNITDKHSKELAGVCKMYGHISPPERVKDFLNDLRKGRIKNVK